MTRLNTSILGISELKWTGMGEFNSDDSKESTCNAGDLGSIPGLGRSPGERNGYPLQYSCLQSPMDRAARWDMTEQLSTLTYLLKLKDA